MHKDTPAPDDTRLVAKLYRLAAAIAVIIALVPPLGYFWMSYQFQGNETLIEAKLHAAFVTQVIRASPEGWQSEAQDLIEQELTPTGLPELRAIAGPHGNLIAQTRSNLAWPVLVRSIELTGSGGSVVGYVNISRSLAPILHKTGLVALAGISLGFVIFMILYTLPLRALNRTLAALHAEKQVAQENGERLQVVIDNADEGIITLDQAGLVESFNAAAEHIFGYAATEIIGRSAETFMPSEQTSAVGESRPRYLLVGHCEAAGRHKQGKEFPIEIAVSEALMKGVPQFVCIVRDIMERKLAQEKLHLMANYDTLTGLPNRNMFKDRLPQALHRASRNNTLVALMFLDLDRFKTINDTLGHGAGDLLLQHVATLLQTTLRKSDSILRNGAENDEHALGEGHTVSRLGGDEFTIILEGIANVDCVALVAQKIIAAFGQPVYLGGHEIYASTSIGIAIYPFDDTNQENLIKDADTAMYRSKELGRNTFQFYTKDLNTQVSNRLTLETDLRRAIEREEFLLHYQPKVDLASGETIGVEALLRWHPPEKGMVSPGDFIPFMEETGLIIPVGEWVIRTACAQNMAWQKNGNKPLLMAVNLSARQFMQKNLAGSIVGILQETGMEARFLELELTESILMQHTDYNIATLAELVAMGIQISIDDFGTGFSSLSYLKRFAVHTLKIDRSFVNDLATGQDDAAIVSAIIALGNSLRLNVIAEGVETQEQLELLRNLGCHQVQGYLLGRPMPPDALVAHIAS